MHCILPRLQLWPGGIKSRSPRARIASKADRRIRSGAYVNLEDSKSAAEYVANAIKLAYKQPPTQLRGQSQVQNPSNNHIQAQKEQQPTTQRSYQEQRRDREILEMQLQKELHQQALLLSSGPSSPSSSGSSSSSSPPSPALAPAPVYEKEPVTRSYELYEHATEDESHVQAQEQDIERHYRPKYSNNYNNNYAPYQPPQFTEISRPRPRKSQGLCLHGNSQIGDNETD